MSWRLNKEKHYDWHNNGRTDRLRLVPLCVAPFLRSPDLVTRWSTQLKELYKPKVILKQIFRIPHWYEKNIHSNLEVNSPSNFVIRSVMYKNFIRA